MTKAIPESVLDLLSSEKKAYAFLGLVKSDGTPQVTPVWFEYDGTHFIFNTARGRVKDKIMHRHPVVAFAICDPANPYRYLQVSGKVVVETEEGGADVIAALAEKYTGKRVHKVADGEVRVTYKVLADRFQTNA
jgi:PPOX class probable F420-dependent enzyme